MDLKHEFLQLSVESQHSNQKAKYLIQKNGDILRVLRGIQKQRFISVQLEIFLASKCSGNHERAEGLVIPETFNETNNTSAFFTSLTALGTLCDFFLGQVKCVRERYPISMVGSVKLHISASFFP